MFDIAFNTFDEIINMKGHGIYVWLVYSISIVIIVVSFTITRMRIKNICKRININNASG